MVSAPSRPSAWIPSVFPAILLLATLLCPIPADGADLSRWQDEDLLDSAIAARDNGDCAWALELLQELLQRPAPPLLRPRALYLQGLCFEDQARWDDAADAYHTLVHDLPEAALAPDAWFRLGMLLERQGRFREAEACYRRILKTYGETLSAPDLRAVETQRAWEQLLQGKVRRALRGLEALAHTWEAMAPEDRRDERFYLAKTHIALGAILSRHATRITFRIPAPGQGLGRFLFLGATGRHQKWLGEMLKEREARIRAASHHYRLAREQKSAIWISAAFFLSGADHVGHYLALNHAPLPRGLNKEEKVLYREALAEQTRPYLVGASQLFLNGHAAAVANGDTSQWATLLARKVELVERSGVEALPDDPPFSGAFWLWSDLLLHASHLPSTNAQASTIKPTPPNPLDFSALPCTMQASFGAIGVPGRLTAPAEAPVP